MKGKRASAAVPRRARLIGTREAASILRVSTSTVQRWLDMDFVKTYKTVGGHRRASRKDLMAFARKLGLAAFPGRDEKRQEILVVDDDEDIRNYFDVFIKKYFSGIKTVFASSGFEAGVKLSQSRPLVVLLDLRMPGMDGIEVCSIIREKMDMSFTHIVGMTVSRKKSELKMFTEAGVEKIIFKPFDKKKLREYFNGLGLSDLNK